MGGLQSTLTTGAVVGGTLLVVGVFVWQNIAKPSSANSKLVNALPDKNKKRGKKGKNADRVGALENTPQIQKNLAEQKSFGMPGGVLLDIESPSDDDGVGAQREKEKKKKNVKKAGAKSKDSTPVPSRSLPAPTPSPAQSSQERQEEGWTKIARHGPSTSSASTTSVTEEENSSVADGGRLEDSQQTLAERLLHKPPKTAVDDMLEPAPGLARVIRVKGSQEPPEGFNWGDYESTGEGRDDADGEDDGWGVVKSRGRSKVLHSPSVLSQPKTPSKAPETLTKKQRQNAAKREAQKEAKDAAEAERQAALRTHKKELEKEKMAEQAKKGGKVLSGGMTASVDKNGRLIWE